MASLRVAVLALLVATSAVSAQVQVFQTAKDTTDRLTRKEDLPLRNYDGASRGVSVTLNRDVTYQTILGFGGAFTEATAVTISEMLPELQEEIIQAYFGVNGSRYNWGRIHMNSCDFSIKSYSYCETAGDFNLTTWNFEDSVDVQYLIPLIKRALAVTPDELRLFVSPWSPPAWMKQNENMVGTFFPRGLKEGTDYEATWALYFSKFLDEYKSRGVDIWAVTIQNEPSAPHLDGAEKAWEACAFTAELQRDFVKYHLGPRLAADHPGTKIFAHEDQKSSLRLLSQTIMEDPEAAKYIAGWAVHWYVLPDDFKALSQTHDKYPDKLILPSEACEGFVPPRGPLLYDWKRGENYGHDILGDLEHHAVGWTDWNMVLNEQGGPNHANNMCDAPIIADRQNQVLHYQIMYYYMGHFSRFLPRGSVRIQHLRDDDTKLESTTFVTPEGKTVVILLNRSESPIDVTVIDGTVAFDDTVLARSIKTYQY